MNAVNAPAAAEIGGDFELSFADRAPLFPEFTIERREQRLDDPGVAPLVGLFKCLYQSWNGRHLRVFKRRLDSLPVFFLTEFFLHPVLEAKIGELWNPPRAKIVMQNAAVIIEVAIHISETIHGKDAFQRGRVQRRHALLRHGKVRRAEHPHVAVTPRLLREPLDGVIDIPSLLATEKIIEALRFAGAAHVHNHMNVAAGDVEIRIAGFHVAANAARADGHDRSDLIVEGVSADAENDRKFSLSIRPIKITVELGAVRRRNSEIALFAEPIFALRSFPVLCQHGVRYIEEFTYVSI